MGRISALATLFLLGAAALPAFGEEVKAPADPVAKAAFDMLAKNCARCHQEGRLSGRERPAKNFGNVLKLDELASNTGMIQPGNPYGSKLFKQIVDKEMPYDVIYEGANVPAPSEADVKALETWIQSLGSTKVAGCATRQFVGNKDIINLIAADLEKLPKQRAKGTRYLTLTHLANGCTDEKAMNVYRQGAIKLVNSLSRSSDVVRLEAIDPDRSILRINIDDLGWSARDWDTVLASYPYNTQPETQLLGVLKGATDTSMPYLRADWFAATTARPPLYNKLLKLPATFQALAVEQGVDLDGDIKKFQAQRAGFQKSGVSQNNRLIERHASKTGYFWTSYDFGGNQARQNLFEFPLGPGGANGFNHDGGETIFSLPNGFQAYYLNNAKGEPLAQGPTNIVRDTSRKDLAVTNGISCMGCHDQGMRKAKDEIRDSVVKGKVFSLEVRNAVEQLYPAHDKMDQIIADDAKRFADAMARAGLDPTLKLNGIEMISALAQRYDEDVDIKLAANELGMSKDEFARVSFDADKKLRLIIRRLEQGLVPRDQFEVTFAALSQELGDEKLVKVAAVPAAGAPLPTAPKSPAGKVDLALTSDKDLYKTGDTPIFTVVSARDCFLTLSNVDDKGVGTVLFPNALQRENRIKANVEFQLPAADSKFQYRVKDQRFETVIAVCTPSNQAVDGIKHDFTRSTLTEVGEYTRSVARAIQIEPKAPGAAPRPPLKAPNAEREISRTAIVIAVK
jgi:hypothetical protein